MAKQGRLDPGVVERLVPGSEAPTGVSAIRRRAVPERPRVLVIDDDRLVRSMMERALERHGFDVVTADGGRAALGIFREQAQAIDLVLLDLTMPDLDGEETFVALREIDPGVRVVFSSGVGLGSNGEGLPAGFSGFVRKPCLPSEVVAVLRAVLNDEAD